MWKRLWSFNAVTLILAIAAGTAVGLGGFTFLYAKGGSYLTNDPAACANCHIMNDQFSGWMKSSHRSVAVCNDCHTPHNFIGKYVTKASNGFWHSFFFTTGTFHEPIQIKPKNREVTEGACRSCHQDIVTAIEGAGAAGGRISCIHCHSTVGHL